ncbi:hypothetical protein ACFPK9_07040 [Rubritalea spongiae]|uniref:Uncharacterized protein n=1 Tax=Rubritalea spongiae TaxID=430797 RepID=A0ABW5E427_9BACT
MKGSPIIATAITILVLLGIYIGMRSILLPEGTQPANDDHAHHDHAGHDHSGHDHPHDEHSGHDDSAVETDFELYFSSTPRSLTIVQPATEKQILKVTDFESPEWFGSGTLKLTGHHVELQVDVEWETPTEMNMVEIILSPAKHGSRSKTLRSDDNISDIADFSW